MLEWHFLHTPLFAQLSRCSLPSLNCLAIFPHGQVYEDVIPAMSPVRSVTSHPPRLTSWASRATEPATLLLHAYAHRARMLAHVVHGARILQSELPTLSDQH